jgi:hypothetical protein
MRPGPAMCSPTTAGPISPVQPAAGPTPRPAVSSRARGETRWSLSATRGGFRSATATSSVTSSRSGSATLSSAQAGSAPPENGRTASRGCAGTRATGPPRGGWPKTWDGQRAPNSPRTLPSVSGRPPGTLKFSAGQDQFRRLTGRQIGGPGNHARIRVHVTVQKFDTRVLARRLQVAAKRLPRTQLPRLAELGQQRSGRDTRSGRISLRGRRSSILCA